MKLDIPIIVAGALFTILLIYGLAYLMSMPSEVKYPDMLKECITSQEAEDYVNRVKTQARLYNITGTPTFLINQDKLISNREIVVFRNALDNPIGSPERELYGQDDIVLGDPNASVWLIEFSSPLCPHCQKFHSEKFDIIYEEYIKTGKVFYVFKGLALFNRDDEKALIKTVYCMNKLDKSKLLDTLKGVFKR